MNLSLPVSLAPINCENATWQNILVLPHLHNDTYNLSCIIRLMWLGKRTHSFHYTKFQLGRVYGIEKRFDQLKKGFALKNFASQKNKYLLYFFNGVPSSYFLFSREQPYFGITFTTMGLEILTQGMLHAQFYSVKNGVIYFAFLFLNEQVYMRPEVNSNRSEISNRC